MCFDYIAENLMVSPFYMHFVALTEVTTYNSDYRASDITFDWCPGLTSQIVSDPDPFGQIFDSVMFPIIAIFPDFENSQKIEVWTEIKNFFGILLRKT